MNRLGISRETHMISRRPKILFNQKIYFRVLMPGSKPIVHFLLLRFGNQILIFKRALKFNNYGDFWR